MPAGLSAHLHTRPVTTTPQQSTPQAAAVPAALRTAARRLRYLRRYPNPCSYQSQRPDIRLGMAYAYEYALRVLIDEFGAAADFAALYYGPQGEDPDYGPPAEEVF